MMSQKYGVKDKFNMAFKERFLPDSLVENRLMSGGQYRQTMKVPYTTKSSVNPNHSYQFDSAELKLQDFMQGKMKSKNVQNSMLKTMENSF